MPPDITKDTFAKYKATGINDLAGCYYDSVYDELDFYEQELYEVYK